MTPMLQMSPLSPDRARQNRERGAVRMQPVHSGGAGPSAATNGGVSPVGPCGTVTPLLVADDDAHLDLVARDQRGPVADDPAGPRPALVGEVGDAGNGREHLRDELRREVLPDLGSAVVGARRPAGAPRPVRRRRADGRRSTRCTSCPRRRRTPLPPALCQKTSATFRAFARASGPATMSRPNAR